MDAQTHATPLGCMEQTGVATGSPALHSAVRTWAKTSEITDGDAKPLHSSPSSTTPSRPGRVSGFAVPWFPMCVFFPHDAAGARAGVCSVSICVCHSREWQTASGSKFLYSF